MDDKFSDQIRRTMRAHDTDVTSTRWDDGTAAASTGQRSEDAVTGRRPHRLMRAPLLVAATVALVGILTSVVIASTRSDVSTQTSPTATQNSQPATTPRTAPSKDHTTAQSTPATSAVSTPVGQSRTATWPPSPSGTPVTQQTAGADCGRPLPNFTLLGASEVRLTFGDQSPTNGTIHVTVTNISTTTFHQLLLVGEVVYLDPHTLAVLGFGGNDLMETGRGDLNPGGSLKIHFIPDRKPCLPVRTSAPLSDGRYPAIIRVESAGSVGVFAIPVIATIHDGWATLSAPDS